MTSARRPKPWHAVVRLKDELRNGELARGVRGRPARGRCDEGEVIEAVHAAV